MATVFAVIVGSILSFSLNKPISASAYELHPTGNRAVYDGYTSAPSGNWYSDNLTVSNSPMITVLTHGLMADASTWSNNYNGNPNMSNFGEKKIGKIMATLSLHSKRNILIILQAANYEK